MSEGNGTLFGLNGNRMEYEAEPAGVVPSVISPPAWEAAMTIMEEVEKLHKEAGFVRREGYSKSTEIAAKMVQLAINKFVAHNTGAFEGER